MSGVISYRFSENAYEVIDQFRCIKIQPKTTDLSKRLWGITTEFVGFSPRAPCRGLLLWAEFQYIEIGLLNCARLFLNSLSGLRNFAQSVCSRLILEHKIPIKKHIA